MFEHKLKIIDQVKFLVQGKWRHNIQNNDTQDNDTKHNDIQRNNKKITTLSIMTLLLC
jgi:hypothetical protein